MGALQRRLPRAAAIVPACGVAAGAAPARTGGAATPRAGRPPGRFQATATAQGDASATVRVLST
jgi:hypothetical protein